MTLLAGARPLLGGVYRACVAPFGRRALARMLDRGFPAQLAAPFQFLFNGALPPEKKEIARRIEQTRAEIAGRPDRYRIVQTPSDRGVMRWAVRAEDGPVTSLTLAGSVSVPPRWGMFLHLCAEAVRAQTILEMGACTGISGAYLVSAPSLRRFVTLEGSPALAPVAAETLARFSRNVEVVEGIFESTLPRALATLDAPLDFAFVDGHHREPATLHYVRMLAPHLGRGALVVLDDISLYDEMRRAWRTAAAMPGVAAAIDAGRFGLLLWEGGERTGAYYDLAKFTGWWRARTR